MLHSTIILLLYRFWHVSSYHFLLKIKQWALSSPLISILLDSVAPRPAPKWSGRLTHSPPCKKKIAVIKMSQANCFDYDTRRLSPSPSQPANPPNAAAWGRRTPETRWISYEAHCRLLKLVVLGVYRPVTSIYRFLFESNEDPPSFIVKVTHSSSPWSRCDNTCPLTYFYAQHHTSNFI